MSTFLSKLAGALEESLTAAAPAPANSVRGPQNCATTAAEGQDSTPEARPVIRNPEGLFGPGLSVAIRPPSLKGNFDALEALWLADQGTAPTDDRIVAALQGLAPEAFPVLMHELATRRPQFLRALLIRGVSRLWADGPASNPQKP